MSEVAKASDKVEAGDGVYWDPVEKGYVCKPPVAPDDGLALPRVRFCIGGGAIRYTFRGTMPPWWVRLVHRFFGFTWEEAPDG